MPETATAPLTDTRSLEKIPGFDELPSIDPESASALDALLAKSTGETAPAPAAEKEAADKAAAAEKEAADKAAADKEAADKEAAEKAAGESHDKTDEISTPEEIAAAKEAADKKAKETPAAKADDFDEVTLPPYTKAKASEAFDKVKSIAREKITSLETERDALKKQNDELAAQSKQGVPKEIEAELKELREFRNKMDVDADPEFKKFDEQIKANDEAIYARMIAAGLTPEHVEQVKKAGGPKGIDWDEVSSKLPVGLKRFIDAKLVENETLADKKARTLEETKKNATEYLQGKQNAAETVRAENTKATEKNINELVPKLGWLEERKPKADASDAEKAVVAEHNKLVTECQGFLKDAISDDSPQARGILAVGYVQLLKLRHDTAIKDVAHKAKVKELESQLKATSEMLERVKKSSTTRLRNSPADETPAPKDLAAVNVSGSDALDAHRNALK